MAYGEGGGGESIDVGQVPSDQGDRSDTGGGAAGVRVDDVVEVTASLDPDLVGRKATVTDLAHKTLATARRLVVEEVTA